MLCSFELLLLESAVGHEILDLAHLLEPVKTGAERDEDEGEGNRGGGGPR